MITRFNIHNFKIFQDNTEFVFRPITFITGANSSGKTSLVKALLVLGEYIETLRDQFALKGTFDPASNNLNLSAKHLKLGSFQSCCNKNSGNETITFGFETTTDLAPYAFHVELVFCKAENGKNRVEGELNSIKVCLGGETLLFMQRDGKRIKLDSLRCGGYLSHCFVSFMKSMAVYNKVHSKGWEKFHYNCNNTYFKNPEIQNIYRALFKTNLTKPLNKLDEMQLMFYFPILEKFKGCEKSQCVNMIEGFVCSETLQFTRPYENFVGIKERVLKSFRDSKDVSFYDYFLKLENKALDEIHSSFSIVGYHSRYNLIRDEICNSMELEFSSLPLDSWEIKEFEDAYALLTMISWDDEEFSLYATKDLYYDPHSGGPEFTTTHKLYEAYREFVQLLFQEILMTPQFQNLNYVNDSFTGVKRLYTNSDESTLAKIVREYYNLSHSLDNDKSGFYENDYYNRVVKFTPGDFMNQWLKEFCDIESIVFNSEEDGLGHILLVKHSDGRICPLADEGHGITQFVHLLLQIECQILRRKVYILGYKNHFTLNVDSLQVDSSVLALEEPEVSLHPSLQSKLAIVFNDAYQRYHIAFIVETHSEYLIRKSQALVAQYDIDGVDFVKNPFKIYYFNNDGSSYEINYLESGRLEDSFGPGFFDEASNASAAILKREKKMSKRK